jgi:hypothetical protein
VFLHICAQLAKISSLDSFICLSYICKVTKQTLNNGIRKTSLLQVFNNLNNKGVLRIYFNLY